MQVDTTQEHSEFDLIEGLHRLSDAGASIIQIRTREPLRAATALRKHMTHNDTPYQEWDIVNGFRNFTKEDFVDHQKGGGDDSDFGSALMKPLQLLRSDTSALKAEAEKVHFFAYVDPQPFTNTPHVAELVQQYAAILPSSNACILFITNDEPLPGIPIGHVLVTELRTPNAEELTIVLKRIVQDAEQEFEGIELEDDDYARLAVLGLGLTHFEFESYTAIALVGIGRSDNKVIRYEPLAEGISEGKTSVVKQSEILELSHPGDIDEVGGMKRLKQWLEKRRDCYSEEAKEFGIEPPKGIALVGVPGTGKSLVAKAVASVFGVPLVRLDFSRVFSKYVGDSESRVRSALKMVESMAPCVLFVDEIDKGLGGAGSGGGDSGTSSRVLGSFLTWLQECTAPVFTMVTANRTDGLPPELLRRGRFDQIFSVSIPNALERKEVLAIHLAKRDRDIESFDKKEIARFAEKSDQYVPAEIESALKDALVEAYADGTDLTMDHIIAALEAMVPMSRSNRERIQQMVTWAENYAISVSLDPTDEDFKDGAPQAEKPASRRRILNRPRPE